MESEQPGTAPKTPPARLMILKMEVENFKVRRPPPLLFAFPARAGSLPLACASHARPGALAPPPRSPTEA